MEIFDVVSFVFGCSTFKMLFVVVVVWTRNYISDVMTDGRWECNKLFTCVLSIIRKLFLKIIGVMSIFFT